MESRIMQYWNNENHYEIISPCAKYVAVLRWNGNAVELTEVRTITPISEDELEALMDEYAKNIEKKAE